MTEKDKKAKEGKRDLLVLVATFVLIVLATLIMCSCRTVKEAHSESVRDSVRTEIRIEKVFVPDTILVPIPPQTAERVTADSSSHLENDYAISDARISEGLLFHTLETKPRNIEVKIEKEIEYRDSIVYRDREATAETTKTVEVRKLTWWDKTRFYALYAAIAALLFAYRKYIIALVRMFL